MHDRCAIYAKYLWATFAPVLLIITVESLKVRPDLFGQAISNPICWLGLLA